MKRYCRNCFQPIPKKGKFCTHCGQKDSNGKIRMGTMLRKLWDSTFHLESKFLRTCWQLFIPGKVTVEFFKGKQDRYPHPLRMFAIVMFFFLFMVNVLLKERNEKKSNDGLLKFSTTAKVDTGDTTGSKNRLSGYERMQYKATLYDFWHDYEKMPDEWKTPASKKLVDSLLRLSNIRHGLGEERGLPDTLKWDQDTLSLGLWGEKQVQLSVTDVARYDADELIQRYDVQGWYLKLFVRQTLKSYKNPDAFVHAYIGSLTWAILALVSIMAFALSLLYWRQKRYYVEHFIFLLHYHTGLFLALLIALTGVYLGVFNKWAYLGVFWLATAGMYMSLRRYYGQTRGKTILKWAIFGLLYYFSFILLFTLGTIVVFAMY